MKHIIYTIVSILISATLSVAQKNDFTQRPDATVFKEVSLSGWIKFRDNYEVAPQRVFETNKASFGLTEKYKMKLVKTKDDEYGYTHAKYQQLYNNINVLGGEFLVHAKNGKSQTGNGQIITPPVVKSTVSLSEEAALEIALRHINASRYHWQDSTRQARLKQKTKNPAATYYPKAQMVYVISADSSSLILCYSFAIMTKEFGKSAKVYIDASNGALIHKSPLETSCDHTMVNTNWYGSRGVFTNDVAVVGNSYDLEDDCFASVYGVYDATDDDDIFNTGDNVWATDWQRSAATSLWCIKESFNWFRVTFGRPGHDDDDGNLDIYQGFNFGDGVGGNNASYSYDEFGDDEIKVGIGNTSSVLDDVNTLDILAHEFTHGVTRYESNLVYEKEPGALNESFSDIFGEWVENKAFGSNNWLIGWERDQSNCSRPLRYMIDPGDSINIGSGCSRNFNQPNTYQGADWITVNGCTPTGPDDGSPNNDFCGVHKNSGVQNQMFYLLVAGGNGWNNGQTSHAAANNGFAWNVTGIGMDNAIRIAYKTLTSYLTSQSTYPDARNAWVQAAENIFGPCSFEAVQTGKAWAAVGIAPSSFSQTMFICDQVYGQLFPGTLSTPKNITTDSECTVLVMPTGNLVEFLSGGKITLNNGFRAPAGSNFRAAVHSECRFATY